MTSAFCCVGHVGRCNRPESTATNSHALLLLLLLLLLRLNRKQKNISKVVIELSKSAFVHEPAFASSKFQRRHETRESSRARQRTDGTTSRATRRTNTARTGDGDDALEIRHEANCIRHVQTPCSDGASIASKARSAFVRRRYGIGERASVRQ